MLTYDELNEQNHKITELSNVLVYLFKDRSMCDSETTCDLFFNFMGKVNQHLADVDHLYHGLLSDESKDVNNSANMFMSGEQELKKIISKYMKRWCNKGKHELRIRDHQEFVKDTQEVFNMVLARIQDETEKLYPLVREIRGDERVAA